MRYRYHTTDVFTDRIFGGNPLAVFPDARGLETATMQRVAAEINYSQTTFVFPPDDPANTHRVRIFTPQTELHFAGHPTVGTAFVLARTGRLPSGTPEVRFEEGIGTVPVAILERDGAIHGARLSAARLPESGPPPPPLSAIAHVLSLDPFDLRADDYRCEAVSCGVPILFVPVRSRDALRRIRLNRPRWEEVLARYWAPSLFAMTLDPDAPDADLSARMFAPALGIDEDPATGAAVIALAGYLSPREKVRDGTIGCVVEQGVDMGRPSRLELEADLASGHVTAIRVGGSAVLVAEGEMEVPG